MWQRRSVHVREEERGRHFQSTVAAAGLIWSEVYAATLPAPQPHMVARWAPRALIALALVGGALTLVLAARSAELKEPCHSAVQAHVPRGKRGAGGASASVPINLSNPVYHTMSLAQFLECFLDVYSDAA